MPGNSVKEVGDRIKGGAVKDERSPENEAILSDWMDIGVVKGQVRDLRFQE